MKSLTKEKRYDLIDAFNSTSRYLDDLLNIQGVNKVRRHCSITYNFRINVHSILKLYRLRNLFNTKVLTILQFLQLYII